MKIAILVCLAALAAAEPEAEAWYGPYGYSNWGYNWMNGNNMMNNMYWGRPGYSQGYRQMNYMNGHEGHRYQSFHNREAEAEPEAKAEAFYGPYSYSNWGNNWPMGYNMYNMYDWNMMNGNNMMNYWNMPYNMNMIIVEEKEKMEVEKKEDEKESRASREFKLYCNFWQLQDYFRDPTQCYDKDEWEQFCCITAEIITCFNKKKLDTRASKKEPVMKESADSFVEEYFPKYLTNQNLLSLQLNDSNFRRYVLMQYLILFQYLQTSVKFKTESQVLSTDNGKWIDDQRKKIYKLLEETPPNGKVFCSSAKSILKREEIWIRWKNEGCVSLVIPSPPPPSGDTPDESTKTSTSTLNPRKRKRPLGDQMKNEAKYGKINLGNKGLTKLWNINTDNLGACKDQERNFLPSLMQFFGDPIEEMKPGSGVEAEYKKVNQGQWGWRALRLMSRRSQHFFLIGNSQINKLPEYLEHMMEKMARDFGIDMEGPAPEEMDTNNGESNGAKAMNMKLTDEQIASLAVKLADVCDKLLPKLGLPDEKVEEIKSFESNQEKCLKLLSSWVEQEADGASPDEIKYILDSLKMSELIDGVF